MASTKNGTNQSEYLQADTPDATLNGFGGNDGLYAKFGGTNFLNGGDGNDLLIGGPGIDHMDGGTGNDNMASYRFSPAGITASLANPALNTGESKGDTYVNVQDLEGTPFNDNLTGDNQPVNVLNGLEGDDTLTGGGGFACVIGGPGADRLIGGGQRGLIDYETSLAGLTASLANPAINTNDAKGDTYQNLWDMAGSAFDDTLFGDANNNNYLGNGGNDILSTGAGNDSLNGGPGADMLTGGPGADMFAFGGSYIIYDPNVNSSDPLAHLVHNDPLAVIAEGKAGIFDRITDFNRGNSGSYDSNESDSLSVSQLTAGSYNHGHGQPADSLVRLVEDASNTFALAQVDIDGSGPESWVTLARFDGVHNGDAINVFLDESDPFVKIIVGGASQPPPGPTVHLDEWMLSNGKWAASVDPGSHPLGSQVSGIGDFNRDGTSDVLWFNPTTTSVDLWTLSNGKWAASNDVGPHPAGYQISGMGDFNGDGSTDVFWFNPTTNETDIWMLANGKWAASTTIGTHPAGYQVAGIGDMNHDGTSDAVWFNPSNGDVDIWKVQNGKWAGSVNPGQHPGAGWQVGGVGDFNNDGNGDIFFFNSGTGETDIWLLNNGQWAGSVAPGNHPGGYQVGGIADFNHDGYSDVLWYNPGTQQVDEWLLANGKWTASVTVGIHGGSIAGIGDFNGNGTPDALWNV
jgi:hypothetical protein